MSPRPSGTRDAYSPPRWMAHSHAWMLRHPWLVTLVWFVLVVVLVAAALGITIARQNAGHPLSDLETGYLVGVAVALSVAPFVSVAVGFEVRDGWLFGPGLVFGVLVAVAATASLPHSMETRSAAWYLAVAILLVCWPVPFAAWRGMARALGLRR